MIASASELDTLLAAYHTLDLDVRASTRAIRHRYHELARRHHPDRWPAGSPQHTLAASRMREINIAYELIEAAPLRNHVFASDPVRQARAEPADSVLPRPLTTNVKTLLQFGLGLIAGGLVALMLYARGVPYVPVYALALPISFGLVFTSTSGRGWWVLRVLWWWV
jgi:preprotein translocase subunit Sec63